MVTLTSIIDLSDLKLLPGSVSEEELENAWDLFKQIKDTCPDGLCVFSSREDFVTFCQDYNYKA